MLSMNVCIVSFVRKVMPVEQASSVNDADQKSMCDLGEQLLLLSVPPCEDSSGAHTDTISKIKMIAQTASVCKHIFICCPFVAQTIAQRLSIFWVVI